MFKKLGRKAYTLIEILAAVVILGILLLIAVPAVNKQLNKFREEYYIKLENSIKSAGKDYVTEKRYSKPTQLLYSRVIKVDTLENEGFIEEVKDYLGEKCDSTDTSYSYMVVVKTGEKKYQYRTCLRCSEDEYFTDTTGEKNDFCNEAWKKNEGISYENEGEFDGSEFLYVYYGTSEDYIKSQVGLEYKVIKKDKTNAVLAQLSTGEAVYPDNLNELVGRNVNTKITLNYKMPDDRVINKEAIIYKHSAPKVTITYANDKYVNGVKVKSAGDPYVDGDWANGLKVKFAFNDTDNAEVLNYVGIDKVQYYDEATDTWKTVCTNNDKNKDDCTWNSTGNFNKTVKFRITNSKGHTSDVSLDHTIRVDASVPTCGTKVENTTWTNATKTVSVGCVDTGYSTCAQATYSATYPTGSIKNKKVAEITIYDNAGNSAKCSLNTYVDTTKPSSCSVEIRDTTGKVITSGQTADYDVTFSVMGIDNATDDSGINTSNTYATINGTKKTSTDGMDNGSYTVTPVCTDNAGNVFNGTAVTFTLRKTVEITFAKNNGTSGTMSKQTCYYNENCTLNDNKYGRTGHTFTGWNTKAAGTGTAYANKGTIKTKTNVTLYAQWQANVYTITYTLNGGTNNNTNPGSYTYGVGVSGFANATKSGYTFKGWYSEAAFTNKITNITTTDLGDKTLYAKWAANNHTLTYDNQGGSGCSTLAGAYDSKWSGLCTPSKTGYTFKGWYTGTNGSGTQVTADTICKGDLKVYAKWTASNYTLTYNNQSGSGCTSQTGAYDSKWGSYCTPSRTGYTFNAWYTGTNGSGTKMTTDTVCKGNLTVYAKWTANVYTITYTLNSGKNHASNPDSYTYGEGVSSFYDATRSCYNFNGWYSEAAFKNKVTSISTTATGNMALFAKWTQKTYKVTYNANGGSGAPSEQTKKCGENLTLSTTKPTKSGYGFNGWNTKADGSGTAYAAGGTYKTDSNVTLYAQWTLNTYTISYDANGGSGAPSAQTKTHGVDIKLSTTTPTKTGHTFAGWNTNSSGTGTTYAAGATYSGNATATLYAKWTANTYTVKYDANGGSGAPSSQTKTYGVDLTLSSTKPTRTGYTFAGWNTNSSGTGTNYSAGGSYTSNSGATLYAKWTANTYTLTYDNQSGSGCSSKTGSYDSTWGDLCTPSRSNYSFKGWFTSTGGSGSQVTSSTTVTGNLTVYASWQATTTYKWYKYDEAGTYCWNFANKYMGGGSNYNNGKLYVCKTKNDNSSCTKANDTSCGKMGGTYKYFRLTK